MAQQQIAPIGVFPRVIRSYVGHPSSPKSRHNKPTQMPLKGFKKTAWHSNAPRRRTEAIEAGAPGPTVRLVRSVSSAGGGGWWVKGGPRQKGGSRSQEEVWKDCRLPVLVACLRVFVYARTCKYMNASGYTPRQKMEATSWQANLWENEEIGKVR